MSKNDTVSKEYLLAEIDDLADEFSEVDENGLHSERWCGILDAKWIIVNAPFVSGRPQGEWLDTGKDPDHSHPLTAIWYKCSECGDGTNAKTNFCPNCGADMRGDNDE